MSRVGEELENHISDYFFVDRHRLKPIELRPKTHHCIQCGVHMRGVCRRCVSCQNKLKKAGLCKICGGELDNIKRKSQPPASCSKCKRALRILMARIEDRHGSFYGDQEDFRRKIRTDEHREVIRDTKFGLG